MVSPRTVAGTDERQIDAVLAELASSSKAEELTATSSWGRSLMARALAKRAKSFARKEQEVAEFTSPENRFERMQENTEGSADEVYDFITTPKIQSLFYVYLARFTGRLSRVRHFPSSRTGRDMLN